MLHLITSLSDPFIDRISDDPVRPGIDKIKRIGNNRIVFVSCDDQNDVQAITCVSFQSTVPTKEEELFEYTNAVGIAVFYSIWSYKSGAGRRLIFDGVEYIRQNYPSVNRFVTLSPKTEMAKNFHLKNGAIIYRENTETVNYEYQIVV